MAQPNRRQFLDRMMGGAAAVVAGAAAGSLQARAADASAARAARKKAAQRRRRLIVDNDGTDCRHLTADELKERVYYPVNPNTCAHTHENFLALRTAPLVDTQVDSLFYCSGVFNLYTHHSPESELAKYSGSDCPNWGWELGEQGEDTLATVVRFGHANGMEVFWSMRMNDAHDSLAEHAQLLCQWKKDHPELLMGRRGDRLPYGDHRWSAVNYELEPVREKVLRILRDVATRYDVDGLHLDFLRHPVLFKPQMLGEPVTQKHCDLLTGLLQRVRTMTDEVAARRGHSVLISVRVPDSLGYSKAIGIDLARWLQDDLVDLVVGGGYFQLEPWEQLVEFGHSDGAPVYACLSGSRLGYGTGHGIRGEECLARWRGEAARAWDADIDGIFLFNTAHDPRSRIYRELGSLETLRGLKQKAPPLSDDPYAEAWLKGGRQFARPQS